MKFKHFTECSDNYYLTFEEGIVFEQRKTCASGSDNPLSEYEEIIISLLEHDKKVNKMLDEIKDGIERVVEQRDDAYRAIQKSTDRIDNMIKSVRNS